MSQPTCSPLLRPLLEEWPDLLALVLAQLVGPGRRFSPRHRMPLNSRINGSKCVLTTWQSSVRGILIGSS